MYLHFFTTSINPKIKKKKTRYMVMYDTHTYMYNVCTCTCIYTSRPVKIVIYDNFAELGWYDNPWKWIRMA